MAQAFTDPTPPAGASLRYTVAAVRPDGSEMLSPELAVTVAASAGAGPEPAQSLQCRHPVAFALDRPTAVRLRIYDAAGRLVRTLVDGVRPAGSHTAFWDGRDDAGRNAASGAYVCRLEAGTSVRAVRMTLLK